MGTSRSRLINDLDPKQIHISNFSVTSSLIDSKLKQTLQKQVTELEKLLENDKDWNPHSNEQTWNLVHPSLYSFVLHYSPVITTPIDQRKQPMSRWIGLGDVANASSNQRSKFQWLPSVFSVNFEGKVSIQSYINNLHPYRFRNLYKSIANIFEKFVPLFEKQTMRLRGKQLQVIVKIVENVLTPEKPSYNSGALHIVLYLYFFCN